MPEYEYRCTKCGEHFEIICSMEDYELIDECPYCCTDSAVRVFSTQPGFVKLAESEIKTLGHLAKRHSETMSDDKKASLKRKNTAYMREGPDKPLPPGMRRIKKDV